MNGMTPRLSERSAFASRLRSVGNACFRMSSSRTPNAARFGGASRRGSARRRSRSSKAANTVAYLGNSYAIRRSTRRSVFRLPHSCAATGQVPTAFGALTEAEGLTCDQPSRRDRRRRVAHDRFYDLRLTSRQFTLRGRRAPTTYLRNVGTCTPRAGRASRQQACRRRAAPLRFGQPGPFCPADADLVFEDLFATSFGQGFGLEFKVLIQGGDKGVVDQHGTVLWFSELMISKFHREYNSRMVYENGKGLCLGDSLLAPELSRRPPMLLKNS
jgi:hypothetical protein